MNQDLPSDSQLGEYVIEKTLGAGGFGVTYLARDSRLGTKVAIKEYFPSAYAVRDPEGTVHAKNNEQAQKIYQWGLAQFLKEAQALAQFKHNNIVRVLRFMEINGSAYMVMEYEPGQSLGAQLEAGDGTLDETRLLQIFIPILNGLQAMHEAGLVHLDVKPDNIYLSDDNRPILIDFGSSSEIAAQKATGQVAITPAYAAIEHYPDKGKQGAWTDIYSIGATMYRCISGVPPIGAMERYKSILEYKKDPLTPVVDLEISGYSNYLRDCIDWSLEIYPQKRPQSAQMLQQGLMGKGRPGSVKQQPATATKSTVTNPKPEEKKQQFDKEGNRLVIDPWRIARWALVALIILAIGGTSVMWFMRPKPATPAVIAESESVANEQQNKIDEPQNAVSDTSLKKVDGTTEIQLPPLKLAQQLGGHNNWVQSLVNNLPNDRMASADSSGKILLWDKGKASASKTINAHGKAIHTLAASADGSLLASAGDEGVIKLWDSITGKTKGSLSGHDYAVYALAFSPDGRWLASAGKDRTIVIWDLAKRKIQHELLGHEKGILSLSFSPDGKLLASGGEAIRLWNMPNGEPLGALYAHKGKVFSLDFSTDGKLLTSAGVGGVIKIWNLKDNSSLNLTGAPETVYQVRFSPDGHWLASAGSNNHVQIWSVDNGNFYHLLRGHKDSVLTLGFSPDGNTLISGSRDHKLIYWTR